MLATKKRSIKSAMFMMHTGQVSINKEPEKRLQKSITMPMARVKEPLDMDAGTSLGQFIKENGW